MEESSLETFQPDIWRVIFTAEEWPHEEAAMLLECSKKIRASALAAMIQMRFYDQMSPNCMWFESVFAPDDADEDWEPPPPTWSEDRWISRLLFFMETHGILSHLQMVNVSSDQVRDAGLIGLSKFPCLKLIVAPTNISDAGARELGLCKTLEKFSCRAWSSKNTMTDEGYHLLTEHWKNLTFFSLASCNITNTQLKIVLDNLPSLEGLSVNMCNEIKDNGIVGVAPHFAKLTKLSLWACESLTDASLFAIAEHSGLLVDLSVGRSIFMTDAGLIKVLDANPKIHTLTMSCSKKFTIAALKHAVAVLPDLRKWWTAMMDGVKDDEAHEALDQVLAQRALAYEAKHGPSPSPYEGTRSRFWVL